MMTQSLAILALVGMPVVGTSDAQIISGERALLNRVGVVPVTSVSSHNGPIDPASALLGRTAERSGFTALRNQWSGGSPPPVGAEQALLGRDA